MVLGEPALLLESEGQEWPPWPPWPPPWGRGYGLETGLV